MVKSTSRTSVHKNELLLNLDELMKSAVCVGRGVDKHDVGINAHLFEIDIMGIDRGLYSESLPMAHHKYPVSLIVLTH